MNPVVSKALQALEAKAGRNAIESYITPETYTMVIPFDVYHGKPRTWSISLDIHRPPERLLSYIDLTEPDKCKMVTRRRFG